MKNTTNKQLTELSLSEQSLVSGGFPPAIVAAATYVASNVSLVATTYRVASWLTKK